MRPIDADNIISVCEILSEKCDNQHYWNQLISIIEDMPTIDAIPVEWLKQQRERNDPESVKDISGAFVSICIDGVLALWQKEQEAKV